MMPLPPERSTMCVPAKPKADFSIDFIVGNNNNASAAGGKAAGRHRSPPARRGPGSPLSGRQATPPYSRTSTSPASPPGPHGPHGPHGALGPQAADDEDDVRARLLSLQAAQAAGLPAGLGGLLPFHHPLHGATGHGGPGGPGASPTGTGTPSPPTSPLSPLSPPHQAVVGGPQPPPFLLRGLYRPEPMLVPPQLQGLPGLHHHLQVQPHLLHGAHPGGPPMGAPMAGPLGAPPKDSYPLYPWLLSRHGRIFPHRFPGVGGPDFAGFLLHPFRKPKRIRTAFSPSQLLKLEHAFENNHYVVGAERKQVAQALGLSETQVKVWFQNRRTKHKRTEQEEEAKRKTNNNNNNSSSSSKQGEDSSASSSSSGNNNSGPQAASWKDEMDGRASPASPSSHRPVDLSSHDDSSDMESES